MMIIIIITMTIIIITIYLTYVLVLLLSSFTLSNFGNGEDDDDDSRSCSIEGRRLLFDSKAMYFNTGRPLLLLATNSLILCSKGIKPAPMSTTTNVLFSLVLLLNDILSATIFFKFSETVGL